MKPNIHGATLLPGVVQSSMVFNFQATCCLKTSKENHFHLATCCPVYVWLEIVYWLYYDYVLLLFNLHCLVFCYDHVTSSISCVVWYKDYIICGGVQGSLYLLDSVILVVLKQVKSHTGTCICNCVQQKYMSITCSLKICIFFIYQQYSNNQSGFLGQ